MEKGQVALVTGGAQGIGAAIVKALLKTGYKVCVADIKEEIGSDFVEELNKNDGPKNVIFVKCDVSDEADFKRAFEFTIENYGNIDVLINNAGIVLEQNPRQVINVNLMGPIIGCQLAFKYMGKSNGGNGGAVINTASAAGFLPNFAFPVYCTSKCGVIFLTRCYGHPYYLEKEGILFQAICPSGVKTGIFKEAAKNAAMPDLDFSKYGKPMSPDYVAQGVLKLLEEKINGSTLLISNSRGYSYVNNFEIQEADLK